MDFQQQEQQYQPLIPAAITDETNVDLLMEKMNQVLQNFDSDNNKEAEIVEYWAQDIIAFSSQYGSGNWSAANVLGEPRVYPNYGDCIEAWAPYNVGGREFLEIRFPAVVHPHKLQVYETSAPGALVSIWGKCLSPEEYLNPSSKLNSACNSRSTGEFIELWKTEPIGGGKASRINEIQFVDIDPEFTTNILRLEIDGRCNAGEWYEIDALKLFGSAAILYPNPKPERQPGTLSYDMHFLFTMENGKDTDFCCSDNKIVSAHRFIIESRCPALVPKIADGDWASTTVISFADVPSTILSLFLEYLYTGDVLIPIELAVPLFAIAHRYNADLLMQKIIQRFKYSIHPNNVHRIIRIVNGFSELRVTCANFIAKNFGRVPEHVLQDLDKENLLLLVKALTSS